MTLVPGLATPEGTLAFRRRTACAEGNFRERGGLSLSSIGIGTYLGDADDATDRLYTAAIARAVELGVNVVNSAINYRAQRSERCVGAALRQAIERGVCKREEIVVATKGGYVPFDGAKPRDMRRYLEETYYATGALTPDDLVAGCHAISPRYLQDQIARSRLNLGLSTIDVYYLHNPEQQLDEVSREEFLTRMRAAFATLEEACAAGFIGVYGTATWNGYRVPADRVEHLSLADLVALAQEVGGAAHHFRVLQLPYSLTMPEAAMAPTQSGRPLLDAAAAAGVYVMASASIHQGRLTQHLPSIAHEELPGLDTDAQRALQFARSTPGVGTALVGMKRVPHVEENLRVAHVPPAPAGARRLLG